MAQNWVWKRLAGKRLGLAPSKMLHRRKTGPPKSYVLRCAFLCCPLGENAVIDGFLIFGFYLSRHAWRKNVSGIAQGYTRLETPRFEPAYAAIMS